MADAPQTSDDIRRQRHEAHLQRSFKSFIKDVCAAGGFSEEFAVRAATAVMCRLEQRIQPNEALDLEAQLPEKFVSLIMLCSSTGTGKPAAEFGKEGFVRRVASDLEVSDLEAETIARAVFAAVRARVSEGEIEDVAAQLPADLETLWARPS